MSDIPDNENPIQIEGARFRSPVSESIVQNLGGIANFLLKKNLKVVEVLTSGTWPVPSNTTFVILMGFGGGGGGGGSRQSIGSSNGGGGAGSAEETVITTVTPLETVTITIGAGGAGGAAGANGSPGATGGSTIFAPTSDPTITFFGGGGGGPPTSSSVGGTAGVARAKGTFGGEGTGAGGGGFAGSFFLGVGVAAQGSQRFNGGTLYTTSSIAGSGPGGAGPYGDGGSGARQHPSGPSATAGAPNSGAGGGGGLNYQFTTKSGLAGGSGKLFILYFGE